MKEPEGAEAILGGRGAQKGEERGSVRIGACFPLPAGCTEVTNNSLVQCVTLLAKDNIGTNMFQTTRSSRGGGVKTRGGRRKPGATLLGERRAARSQARAEAAPAAERRERGAERRGLRARRNVNQIPEPRESPPICSDLTWLLAAAAAAAPEQINRRTRSAAQRGRQRGRSRAQPPMRPGARERR